MRIQRSESSASEIPDRRRQYVVQPRPAPELYLKQPAATSPLPVLAALPIGWFNSRRHPSALNRHPSPVNRHPGTLNPPSLHPHTVIPAQAGIYLAGNDGAPTKPHEKKRRPPICPSPHPSAKAGIQPPPAAPPQFSKIPQNSDHRRIDAPQTMRYPISSQEIHPPTQRSHRPAGSTATPVSTKIASGPHPDCRRASFKRADPWGHRGGQHPGCVRRGPDNPRLAIAKTQSGTTLCVTPPAVGLTLRPGNRSSGKGNRIPRHRRRQLPNRTTHAPAGPPAAS